MATLPTLPDTPGNAPAQRLLPQSDALVGLSNLNLFRQLGLLVGIAASVAIGVAVVLWSRGEDYRPLYGSLERLDSGAVLDVLDSSQIKYRIDNGTGALLVEADKIHQARLKLAEAGMPGEKAVGFELLDKEQPLGTSQFMEGARYRRSLEGELARTIASITSVRGARVHLAIPKESVFVRDARPSSASVFVELFPGASLAPAQVKSIVNLVASSIAQMQTENVTVVDQKGNLLSQIALEDPTLAQANRQLEYTHRIERRLLERVNSILEPLLGAGKFRAEVAADVDFTAVEQADEVYNPDLPALRSEQRIAESRGETAPGGVPGALSNQPPADGVAPEQVGQGTGPTAAPAAGTPATGNGRAREQYVRNFELDRTLSYTRHQVGQLRRLTVAVAVDNRAAVTSADGAEATSPAWQAEELERLSILVRNAVGFDPARGDIVNVVNSAFIAPPVVEMGELETTPWWQQGWVMNLAKQGAGLLMVLILVFAVLRPVMRSLSQAARDTGSSSAAGMAALGPADLGMGVPGGDKVTLSGGDSLLLPGPNDAYEQQITAIKGMIAEDPGRVAQVVKKWVASSD